MDIRYIKGRANEEVWYDHDHIPFVSEESTPLWRLYWHRIGGPAYINNASNEVGWYLNERGYRFKDYCEQVKSLMSEEDYLVMILTYSSAKSMFAA